MKNIREFFCSVFLKFLAVPHSMWDLSSPPGIKPLPPEVEVRSPNHWTIREVPYLRFF